MAANEEREIALGNSVLQIKNDTCVSSYINSASKSVGSPRLDWVAVEPGWELPHGVGVAVAARPETPALGHSAQWGLFARPPPGGSVLP